MTTAPAIEKQDQATRRTRRASSASNMADVLAAHRPSRWRSFMNDNEVLRCCGQDFGNATKRPSRDDAQKAWAAFAAHQAAALSTAGFADLDEEAKS